MVSTTAASQRDILGEAVRGQNWGGRIRPGRGQKLCCHIISSLPDQLVQHGPLHPLTSGNRVEKTEKMLLYPKETSSGVLAALGSSYSPFGVTGAVDTGHIRLGLCLEKRTGFHGSNIQERGD